MRCIPFYLDDNSNNLPFYLIKDRRGNDVIYINDNNMIYTNTKCKSIGQQLNLFTMCFNQGICSVYRINEKVSVIKKVINNDMYWYINTNDCFKEFYYDKLEQMDSVNMHFNSKYLCLTNYEYGESIPEVVAGYDFTNDILLDCNNYETANNLYKSLVEARRCRFDIICSILKNEIYVNDDKRLYSFLSFLFNDDINKDNYMKYIPIAKEYIISKYPEFIDIEISDNIDDIKDANKKFGINYFYFNRIDKEIDNLKYVKNKEKIMKI